MPDKGRFGVVVVTGASAGVGRATALAFADKGAAVALLARGEAGLEGARREVEARGVRALAIPVDVADAAAVEAAAARVEAELGPIDVWVNNAMTSVFSPFAEMDATEFRRVTEVTYLGTVHGTMAALRRMRPRDAGVIVQVGSALAYRAIPLQSAYCGAKHAVRGFSDSLRSELIRDGSRVRVVAVHLPAVNTPQFGWVRSRLPNRAQPVPPIYQPEIPAAAIVWAAAHERRELLVGVPTVQAVWGNKFIPGLLDRYLARAAWEGQQLDEPRPTDQPENLFHPADARRDEGAHGAFDRRARTRSLQLWLSEHRGAVFAAAGMAAFALGLSRRDTEKG